MTNSVQLSPAGAEAARRQQLLTVSELQWRARVSHKTLWLARTGQPIGLVSAKKVARALRVPLRTLIASEPWPDDKAQPAAVAR